MCNRVCVCVLQNCVKLRSLETKENRNQTTEEVTGAHDSNLVLVVQAKHINILQKHIFALHIKQMRFKK